MTRTVDEWAAALFDVVPGDLALVLLFALAGLTGLLWWAYPRWVPRRLPRLRLPRLRRPRWRWPRWRLRRLFRRRRRARPAPAAPVPAPAPGPVTVTAGAVSSADRLAAEGRYAEAIRQRLRDLVAALVRAGVVAPPQPGTTAAELAAAAADRHPGVAVPLRGATDLFSEAWYGRRPVDGRHDAYMRTLAGQVTGALAGPDGAAAPGGPR